LLIGIAVGILAGLYFVLKSNFKSAIFFIKDDERYLIRFRKEVSFLNKGLLKKVIEKIPDNSAVLIDATKSEFIDVDIVDLVNDFIVNAETRGIRVYLKNQSSDAPSFFEYNSKRVMQ
jgi:MFS superfamily sulfate permease-like transporter